MVPQVKVKPPPMLLVVPGAPKLSKQESPAAALSTLILNFIFPVMLTV
jgi:hypothetical protein